MYSAKVVAQYIIAYEHQQNRCVSNLRLQMLLYFVQAKYLVSTGDPLFWTPIEAWTSAPVVPRVYQEFRIFGGATIPISEHTSDIHSLREEDAAIINPMLECCAKYSTTDLINNSKNQKPWRDARSDWRTIRITTKALLEYFAEDITNINQAE